MTDSPEKRAAKWAAGFSTGVSSKAILKVMLGDKPEDGYCYPHDADDLGRCIGLLDAVPEYRDRIGEMSAVGPEWEALAARWSELEAAYRAGDHVATRKLVKAIIEPIEAKRLGLFRLGDGVSLYFPQTAGSRRT